MKLKNLLLIALLTSLLAPGALGITRGTQIPDADARFDAVGAFATTWRLGIPFNPPPPESGDSNWYCSAVLVEPDRVAIARHCTLAYGEEGVNYPTAVRFRRKLDGSVWHMGDPAASAFQVLVDHYIFPDDPSVDFAYAVLTSPVTHIPPFSLTFFPPDLPLPTSGEVVLVGWGKTGEHLGEGTIGDPRSCLTSITSAPYPDQALWVIDFVSPYFPNSTLCGANSGDSGGAVLVLTKDGPMLIGVINAAGWGAVLQQ